MTIIYTTVGNNPLEEMESKQKQVPVMDVTGDGSGVQCCKEQYCIGTWNVRSMNQGKLKVVKRDGKSECQHSSTILEFAQLIKNLVGE